MKKKRGAITPKFLVLSLLALLLGFLLFMLIRSLWELKDAAQ
jgi:hypothetical protein